MFRILLPTLDLLRPESPSSVILRRHGESLLSRPVTPLCRVGMTLQASFFDRACGDRSGSGTLRPPTRRLDGYGRASESFEVEAHGR